MEQLSLRLYILLSMFVLRLRLAAQDIDDVDLDYIPRRGRGTDDEEGMVDLLTDYQPFHFSIFDIFMIVLLLLACYVFGKIWKGCSYLLIVVAVVFYYLLRY